MAAGVGFMQPLRNLSHRRKVVRNIRHKRGEVLFNIAYKCRAAGGGQKALLGELLRFKPGDHVRTPCSFDNRMEAEPADARNNLLRHGIGILAGHGGRDNGIHMIILVIMRIADERDYLRNAGFIGNCAKGALIDTRAAGDALLLVDYSLLRFGVNMDCLWLAGAYAGARMLNDGGIGANSHAAATFHAFFLVDYSAVVDDGNRTLRAIIHAAVRKAAAAGGGNLNAVHRAFVARDGEHAHDGTIFFAAERHADALIDDGALFINAATEHRLAVRNDGL